MNVSEYIIDFFAKKGIDKAFLVTGGQAMFLNDALGKHPAYELIYTHHEQAAAMSADAYSRVSNKPAIAMVTAGPGAINALTGVAGAYTDSAPMIVLSGQSASSFVTYQEENEIRQFGIQGIHIEPIVKPITKYFVTLKNIHDIPNILEKAYIEATTGRPGPVWVEVPLDIQKTTMQEIYQNNTFSPEKNQHYFCEDSVNSLFKLIKQAKRPLLLVGQGIRLSHSEKEFKQLLEHLKIPVITSRLGIDLMESDHPQYVGRPGTNGERSAHFAVQNTDLLIVIGSRLASSTVGHNAKDFARNAYKFVVDIDLEELNKPSIHIDQKVHCDVKIFLQTILANISTQEFPDFTKWLTTCESWKYKYPVVLPEYKLEEKVNSYYLIKKLSELVNSQSMILVDTGSCFHVACQAWKVKLNQRFITTGGLSSMGYWCAGIGVSLVNKNVNTIVITGDGSFQMNIQELATIKHNKLPIKIFIINNNGYLLIRHTQKRFMEGKFIGESPDSGLWCPDALEIAKAYGIKGIRINNATELDEKIKEVLAHDGPVICDVMSPEWQELQPKIASEKLADGTMVSKPYEDLAPFIDPQELAEIMKISEDRSEIQK